MVEGGIDFDGVEKFGEESGFVKTFGARLGIKDAFPIGWEPLGLFADFWGADIYIFQLIESLCRSQPKCQISCAKSNDGREVCGLQAEHT
jgi:hypothetical protein